MTVHIRIQQDRADGQPDRNIDGAFQRHIDRLVINLLRGAGQIDRHGVAMHRDRHRNRQIFLAWIRIVEITVDIRRRAVLAIGQRSDGVAHEPFGIIEQIGVGVVDGFQAIAFNQFEKALRADAAQDVYGLNLASERDFGHFIRSEPFIRKGNLVLMDNGNLRAVWKGEDGTHIGLQFLGGRMVQYVIFKRRSATEAVSRVAGRDSFEGVKRQIQAFDLQSLIYA